MVFHDEQGWNRNSDRGHRRESARLNQGSRFDLRFARPGAERRAYPAAKIACFCLTTELARRYPGVFTAIIDPGLVATELHRDGTHSHR